MSITCQRAFELVRRAADVRLAGVGGAAAIEDVGVPRLVPEPLELDRLAVRRLGMQRYAVGGPLAQGRIEAGEEAPHRILAGGAARQRRNDRGGRALDDVEDPLAVEECKSVGEDEARNALAGLLGGAGHHHAPLEVPTSTAFFRS